MPIKRQSIENLKTRVSLVEVASRVMSLKKRGHSYVGLSPFSNEKSPSFYIQPDKNVFYCFSTNKGGDVITFVQLTERLDFNEAVEVLAERFNVPLEYEEGTGKSPVNRSLKKELLEIHLYAAEFFHKALMANHPEALAAREYWEGQRKFSLDLAKDFQVGYAPAASDKLLEILQKKGFSTESLAQCGLYFVGHSGTYKPRFRGRLMIPLRDSQGQVIGFTGRKMAATPKDDPAFEAKYVNSPETPLFKKGNMLFNFDRARNAVEKQGFFLMVEGQLDSLRAYSVGFHAVVAPQGTAVTPEQLSLLKRYDNRLRVFLDGDRAGQAAALRMLPMALAEEMDILFLKLPPGIDPDLYLLEHPTNALKNLEGLSPMAFALQALYNKEEVNTPQAKANALHAIFELIKASPSAIVQEAYLEEVIRRAHLDNKATRRDFDKIGKKEPFKPLSPNALQGGKNFDKNLTTAEFELLWLLVQHPGLGAGLSAILLPEWLDLTDGHGKLLNAILAESSEGTWEGLASVDALGLPEEERTLLMGLAARPLPHDEPHKIANDALRAIFTKYIERAKNELKQQLQNARDEASQAELLKKQQNLLILQKKIPSLPHG